MSAPKIHAWAAVLGLLLGLSAFGCAKVDRDEPPRGRGFATPPPANTCACPEGIVDPTLIAFLSKARAAHHEADLAEDGGDKRGAVSALERLVAGPRPGGGAPPPEVVEVLADTRARLADLRSSIGQSEAAERDVEEGLRLATQPTHFRGHLYEVLGVVFERRAKALAETGDAAAAERARRQAVDAYRKAIGIQDDVIRRALPPASPR